MKPPRYSIRFLLLLTLAGAFTFAGNLLYIDARRRQMEAEKLETREMLQKSVRDFQNRRFLTPKRANPRAETNRTDG